MGLTTNLPFKSERAHTTPIDLWHLFNNPIPRQKADFLAPIDDPLSVAVGSAVDDLDVVVDELGGKEAVGAEVD